MREALGSIPSVSIFAKRCCSAEASFQSQVQASYLSWTLTNMESHDQSWHMAGLTPAPGRPAPSFEVQGPLLRRGACVSKGVRPLALMAQARHSAGYAGQYD